MSAQWIAVSELLMLIFPSQTTLTMPANIQDRISHLIDTAVDMKLIPAATFIDNKIAALSTAQASSANTIIRSLQEIRKTTAKAIHTNGLEGCDAEKRLETHPEQVLISQETFAETSDVLHSKFGNMTIAQSTSTDIIVQSTKQAGQDNVDAVQLHSLETRAQSLSLHRKLVEVSTSMGTIHNSLQALSASRPGSELNLPEIGVERAIQDTFGSIWLLLSSLQQLVRELV